MDFVVKLSKGYTRMGTMSYYVGVIRPSLERRKDEWKRNSFTRELFKCPQLVMPHVGGLIIEQSSLAAMPATLQA